LPPKCSVCSHPDRAEIDQAILEGLAFRIIAQRFDLHPSAVCRHKKHIQSDLVKAKEAEIVTQADDLLGKLTGLEAEARRIGGLAETTGDLRLALQAIRELVRIVEIMAKIRGEIESNTVINVIQLPQWQEVRTIILSALEPHQEARLSVAAALNRLSHV
jgi:hypothetical protein